MTEISPFSPEEIASEGIKPEEYQEIVNRLGRHPNLAELGMFGVMWSEHCCYKNSRPLLKQFPTTGDRILVGPGENAGVVDLGSGLQLAFKIESHNHPSAIEPFQGAATGVGGILRDIFTMGARPIALLNSLRFGSLDDSKTRRLFNGVVAGISHYGNCLIESETLIWRDMEGVHFDTIGNFVESRLTGNQHTLELSDNSQVETLSINPETLESCWQPVKRIFKRQTKTLVKISTGLGRTLTVTPDHPVMTFADGQWQTCQAKNLQIGDRLPILATMPLPEIDDDDHAQPLCLLSGVENPDQVYVDLPSHWQVTDQIREKMRELQPVASSRSHYLTTRRLPLSHYQVLEPVLNCDRSQITLFKRGKANHIKAVIYPDALFARLLGYYLAEGCVAKNGNTYKIIFTFGLHETEYVNDVVKGLESLGLRANIEKRSSTIVVYATSWLFGHALKNLWQCGTNAYNKAFPAFVFQWSRNLQRETLKGLLRGDGSLSTRTHGNHAKISFATTSHQLFEQTVSLIQNQGAIPLIYQRPEQEGEIEGRKHITKPLWQLEVCNFVGLNALSDVFSTERNAQLQGVLQQYQGKTHSFPRYQSHGDMVTVKVKNVEILAVPECDVYDIEVENTHLFVTTSGIITHNCVGVPTVGGEVYFDPAYTGNPLVNVMALGIMETSTIVKSGASGIGNPVLYVGSTTGRDGMGGASFASAELSEESEKDRPAVQVGDPFMEKSLIEACLEAFKTGAVVAAQDMGAAGITCSTSEMAAKGGVGIQFDLDKVPARETGMIPYEYLLSESQERMLFVAHKGREQELIDIFHRWGLQAVVAGEVIAEPIVRILFKGEIAAEVPSTSLAENTPIYHRELLDQPPEYAIKAWQWTAENLPVCDDQGIEINGKLQSWNEVLLQLLDTPTIASKKWVYRQYDHQVQNNTVIVPGGSDAAVVRIRPLEPVPTLTVNMADLNMGVAATVDCNSRYVYLHPYQGAKAVVAEAARNLSCVGAEPVAVTDNLNFGSPEKPVGYWQLALACQGISESCTEFKTPVTGGNVSLYNETLDAEGKPESIYPTPVIGMVGIIPDLNFICGQGFQKSDDLIYLLGEKMDSEKVNLGASEYLASIHNTIAGKPPEIDFELERKVQKTCREGIRKGWIKSAHDSAEGGVAIAIAESCISGNLGAEINLNQSDRRWDEILFSEGGARIIVSISPENQTQWEEYLKENLGENWQLIGKVTTAEQGLVIDKVINLSLEEISDRWSNSIQRKLEQ
jgi:phosphoribosylformylglycinamidine synthase subunit PurL